MKRVWFPAVNLLSCWVRSVEGQAVDSLTTLNSNVSFLESGLTTLGVLSAAITVLARADLAYESMLRDWQYTVIDGVQHGASSPTMLLVSNLESIALSLLTTRIYQGAGMECAIVKWEHLNANNMCGCLVIACPDTCVDDLQAEWEDQVVLNTENNTSKAILYSSNCWIQDDHWEFARPARERIPESDRHARAQIPAPQVPMGVQALPNIREHGKPDIGALLIPVFDQDDLVKMMQEEFTCRDEASRNRIPRAITAMVNTRLEYRASTEESVWQTNRWRCLFLHVIEIVVTTSLTVFFTIDPFTSSLAARRVVSGFVASESGGAPYAGHFVDQLRFFKPSDPTILKYTYVLRVPPSAGISYLFIIAFNLLVWLLLVGFWLGRVGGGIPAVVYQSGLYQNRPGTFTWTLAGVIQVLALAAEMLRLKPLPNPNRPFRRLVVLMFPRVEACTTLLVVAGGVVPPVLHARKEVQLLCSVATMWLSAAVTWVVSVYISRRHTFNSLPPDTSEAFYYAAAFFKLAVITAGSGTWR